MALAITLVLDRASRIEAEWRAGMDRIEPRGTKSDLFPAAARCW